MSALPPKADIQSGSKLRHFPFRFFFEIFRFALRPSGPYSGATAPPTPEVDLYEGPRARVEPGRAVTLRSRPRTSSPHGHDGGCRKPSRNYRVTIPEISRFQEPAYGVPKPIVIRTPIRYIQIRTTKTGNDHESSDIYARLDGRAERECAACRPSGSG